MKQWVEALPDSSVLEIAPAVRLNGQTLSAVRARQRAISDEIDALRAAPIVRADDRECIASHVDELAREAAPGDHQGRVWANNGNSLVCGGYGFWDWCSGDGRLPAP